MNGSSLWFSSLLLYLKAEPCGVGQFDREGDKNKLHPLFPVQTEMFPKEWGKGTYLQGEKVLTSSKTHCLFSIKWCHDWFHNVCSWLQNGILEHSTSGTSCFHKCVTGRQILVQNEGNVPFCLKEHTWCWEEQIRETEAKKFEIPSVLGGLLFNSVCVIGGECLPWKPD